MRSLGLDVGDRKIGVALSDPLGIVASPLTIINVSDTATAISDILNVVSRNQVGQIIVGLPCSMDGSIGQQAKKVQAFVAELCEQTRVPVEFMDERLSTVAAKRLMQGTKKTGKKNRDDDDVAAAIILQCYLDEAS